MGNQGNKGKSKKQDKFEKDEKKEQQKKRAEGSDMEEKQIETELIRETGAVSLERNKQHHRIELLTIIGEIEGHDVLSGNTKATKYEHIIPKLAQIEDSCETDGVLIILNTMGGDVEAGLAIAEMIASLSKPTVSLVLGGGHSIGVPIAVSADYSFIVESATMVVHPVRMNGMVIGTPATYDYFKSVQDRITGFVVSHSNISQKNFEKLLMETKMLTKDVGSLVVGPKAVTCGLIDAVGGLKEAMAKLHEMIDEASEG